MKKRGKKISLMEEIFRGGNLDIIKTESRIRAVNFYLENKKWLEELAQFGDDYSQAMAIVYIKTAKEILNKK